jgi:hypothetical protein
MGFHSSIACSLLLGSEIVARYERPFPRLRPLLCLAQRSFPLFAGVVLSALLCKDGIRNFEDAMRRAMEAGGVPGTVEAPLRWGFADWAKEGSGHLSNLLEATFCLSCVYRLFCNGLCQSSMGLDPLDGIFLGRKLPEIVHPAIRPRYPRAPNAALLHWRVLENAMIPILLAN